MRGSCFGRLGVSICPIQVKKRIILIGILIGAPGRFGVVLEFVLRAYPTQGPVHGGPLVFPGTAFEAFVPVLDVRPLIPSQYSP